MSYPRISYSFLLSIIFCSSLPFEVIAGPIQLPKTGQTSCFSDNGSGISCTGTGQDGEKQAGVTWPSPRFTVDGLVVTDNLTGLMWTTTAREAGIEYPCYPSAGTTAMTWEQAFALIACLNTRAYATYDDWRLPNVLELESLINLQDSQAIDWLEDEGFINPWGSFWTSTTSPWDADYAYRVNYFHPGSVSIALKTDQNGVWAVRGATSGRGALMKTGQTTSYHSGDDGDLERGVGWVNPRFEEEGECIYDAQTRLMWTRSAELGGATKPFDDAILLAKQGRYCGHADWRVPNRKELLSMIHFGEASGINWLKNSGFTGIKKNNKIWSSSAYMYQSNSVWALFMQDSFNIYADVKQKSMGYKNAVWLVRSVPPAPPSVTQVVPSQGPNDYPVTIYVNGANFSQGDIIFLGSRELATYYSSSRQLAAYIPMAITPGTYPVKVRTAALAEATLADAFTVLPPTADDLYANAEEFKSSSQIEWVGQTTTLTLLVRRFGGVSPITDLQVRFYRGADSSGTLIGTGIIPSMLPFSSAAVSVNWTPEQEGFTLITAVIDSPPGETNPATNTVTTGVQVVKLAPTATPRPTATPAPAKPTATPWPTPTPQIPDQTAPVIQSFTLDNGALNNTSGSMTLSFTASDPDSPAGTASGVRWAYYTVWEFYSWANDWFVTYESGWFSASSGLNTLPYSAGYFSGPRVISLWVADTAQNVSSEVSRLINYIKPDDYVFEGESKWYLYPLLSGEAMYASCYYRLGDADLYFWPPDWDTRGVWSSLYTNPDVVGANIPIDGYYWLEVYGYQFAEYDLSVTLALNSKLKAAQPANPEQLRVREPRSDPGISMNMPNVVRKLEDNPDAFKVALVSPRNRSIVKSTATKLKWQKLYLGQSYTVQTSLNGKRWKKAGKPKKNKTFVPLTGLKRGKTYYWRVKGKNPLSGDGVWSDTWSFTTKKK